MAIDPPEFEGKKEKDSVLPKRWEYETFREYLLSQARGREFLLPLNEFPEQIELSRDWHEVLNTLRRGADKDNVERVSMVGYNHKRRVIYLPHSKVVIRSFGKFEQGDYDQLVNPILVDMQRLAGLLEGIEGFVGLLHSHPPTLHILGQAIHLGENRLSAGDLYNVLHGTYGSLGGVADGPVNSFAFKTRESVVPRESPVAFYDLWEREPQPNNLDVVLAQNYKLALYKGNKDGVLRRVCPIDSPR